MPHVILTESFCEASMMRSTGIPPNLIFLHLMKEKERESNAKLDNISSIIIKKNGHGYEQDR